MILITGATGHVGKELVLQLLEAGQPIRVLTRDLGKVAELDPRVERVQGDLNEPESLLPAVRGVDGIFLVTLQTRQDRNVLQAAKRAGVRHIVKLSTLEASEHRLKVGQWHFEREELIRASGLEWTILRPGMFMSNSIDWWAESIKRQSAVYFPGGKGRVAPVDPRDVAAAAAAALTRPEIRGQALELTGSELMTIGDMVQRIGRVLGKPVSYTDIPPLAAKLWMLKSGMDRTLVNALMEMMASLRKGEGELVTDAVRRVTGRPARTFEAWCRDHIQAFQA